MTSFNFLIGQAQAVDLLQQAIAKDRIAPAYLFAGATGVGKSLAAKSFAQLLMCQHIKAEKHPLIRKKLMMGNHPDLLWLEPTYLHQGKMLTAKEAQETGVKRKAPPQIRIEQVRDISQFLARPPLEASRSVVIIEDAQTMAEGAGNALLKTLEEPGKATLILLAPSPDSLLTTLVSRCQKIPFYRLAESDLKQVLEINAYGNICNDPALLAVAQGSPGDAIYAFKQLQELPPNLLTKLMSLSSFSLDLLILSKEVSQNLSLTTQLWLIDYLQYIYWQKWHNPQILTSLEKSRKLLLRYVQPRLVWECFFLAIQSFIVQHN
jgi:DNA polymerase III subunit delta'